MGKVTPLRSNKLISADNESFPVFVVFLHSGYRNFPLISTRQTKSWFLWHCFAIREEVTIFELCIWYLTNKVPRGNNRYNSPKIDNKPHCGLWNQIRFDRSPKLIKKQALFFPTQIQETAQPNRKYLPSPEVVIPSGYHWNEKVQCRGRKTLLANTWKSRSLQTTSRSSSHRLRSRKLIFHQRLFSAYGGFERAVCQETIVWFRVGVEKFAENEWHTLGAEI